VQGRQAILVFAPHADHQRVLDQLRETGWRLTRGFAVRAGDMLPRHTLRCGTVRSPDDAAQAVLAVLRGEPVVVVIDARADEDLVDRLCEDLSRLGQVDYRTAEPPSSHLEPALSDEQRSLLRLLAHGATLGQAARRLGVSRRTADRRLAGARRALHVGTTVEALVAAGRLGILQEDFR
jgi:DNA-binding NarL/FixJ family response regulator